jgi:CarD family transcriptional regulator
MTFRVGERVVYPNQGVATIENISTRNFGIRPERYYLLRLASNDLTIIVPFSHVGDVGLRKVTRNGKVEGVLRFLADGDCKGCRDWKNRFKENSEKMRNGELLDVAHVLKGLLKLQNRKPLSFREKKMLDKARHMLIMEISISRSIREAEAVDLLQDALDKADLELPSAM